MNKNKSIVSMFVIVMGAFFAQSKSFAEPANLGLLKKEIKTYYDAGIYEKELTHVAQQATKYIVRYANHNAAKAHPKKLALVLDIDETSLSNYDFMVANDFSATPDVLKRENSYGQAKAIAPILALYQQALTHGVAVFFVTGRSAVYKQTTEKNLKHEGFTSWTAIYFNQKPQPHQSVIAYKEKSRCNIEEQGYQVIASIGDQWSDLKGRCAEKTFKLPNAFYYIG